MSATLKYLTERIALIEGIHSAALKRADLKAADDVAMAMNELRDLKIIMENEIYKKSKSHAQ